MRLKIVLFLCVFIFAQDLEAKESGGKLTRIAIATSDAVKYESRWLDNPPRLIIRFKSKNVFGQLIKKTKLNEGVIKDISVSYYPSEISNEERRRVKFLTFWLKQKTPYVIRDAKGRILIDFSNPLLESASKEIEISKTISVKDSGSREKAIASLLASFESSAKAQKANTSDVTWVWLSVLISVYLMWFRPGEWRNFIKRFTETAADIYSGSENRKWWRHNLVPLKDKNIYIKVDSPETKTRLGLMPRDIGYGGLCFECNRFKKLKGRLNLRIFLPGVMSPVELEGNVAWQGNSWNLFRRKVGISFVNPPQKEWAHIHNYIEEQYIGMRQ